MLPIRLNVVKPREITNSESKFSFGDFKVVCDEKVNDDIVPFEGIILREFPVQTNQVPVPERAMDREHVRALMKELTKMLSDKLLDDFLLYPVVYPKTYMKSYSWDKMVRENRDPITDVQLDELAKRFRLVETRGVRENFSRNFADFLIKAIDFYKIDLSTFDLKSDAYVDNRVKFEHPYHINFQGDVQRPNWNEGDTQFVVLHELRHVIQHLRGWLLPNDAGIGLIYKGVRTFSAYTAINYNLTPCEYDANRFTMESPLWTKKNLSEFASIPLIVEDAPEAQYNRWNERDG